jgi:hypothetical protein
MSWISDYTTASIRNQGQIPLPLRERADRVGDSYGAVWRQLFDEATRTGELRPDADPRSLKCWYWERSAGRWSGGIHAALPSMP